MIGKKLKPIFGVGEITNFDPQIIKAFRIMDTLEYFDAKYFDYDKIDEIEDLGFDHNHSSGHTFIGRRQVIKLGLFTSKPPPREYRVPTVIYSDRKVKCWDWTFAVAIQPKVNRFVDCDDECDVEEMLFEKFGNDGGTDIHEGNYGYYRNRVVLFDW
jgi:hypothetical protein